MRSNSVISDPQPFNFEPPKPVKKEEPDNDFEKIANSEHYPQIMEYLANRIAFHQRFLPDGTPIENASQAEQLKAWNVACEVIAEFKMLQDTFKNFKRERS
jgi:hypothetical protein